jgi:Heterokaryon incompatibility protein (HET)
MEAASVIMFLIAGASCLGSVAVLYLQKLALYPTHLTSTSELVLKAAITWTVVAAIIYAAHFFLFFLQSRPHMIFSGPPRTHPTPFVPPLINFEGTDPSYTYEKLDTDFIRILEFLPSDDSQPISCYLHQVNLMRLPKYEALSYTWGTDKSDCAISIDGKRFMIRPNIYYALRVFRPPPMAESRWLWIDALCINQ